MADGVNASFLSPGNLGEAATDKLAVLVTVGLLIAVLAVSDPKSPDNWNCELRLTRGTSTNVVRSLAVMVNGAGVMLAPPAAVDAEVGNT